MNPALKDRKILITTDTVGGVWIFALELADALRQNDIEVALVALGDRPSQWQRRAIARRRNIVLFERQCRLEWMDDPWEEVDAAGDWLMEVAAQFGPDVVHLNGYSHAALPWNAPVLLTGHSCVCSWWRAVKGEEAPPRYAEYRERVRTGLRAADLVVTPTMAMLEQLRELYDFSGNACVIPNARTLRRPGGSAKCPCVISVGRVWDEAKNFGLLDLVAPAVKWPVEIAGDCQHPGGSRVSLRNVRQLGKLSSRNVAARLAKSAIFALPARYEPFGLSALEAALSGCALVLGDIPSFREIWGNTAVFVDPDDGDALGEAINKLIDDSWQRAGLARRAQARAAEFSTARFAAGYLAAYSECLSREGVEAIA